MKMILMIKRMTDRRGLWWDSWVSITAFLCVGLSGSATLAQPETCNPVCPAGQECRQNDCVISTPFVDDSAIEPSADAPLGTCLPTCRSGYRCESGQCIAVPCVPDCRSGYVCQAGVCQAEQQLPPVSALYPNGGGPTAPASPVYQNPGLPAQPEPVAATSEVPAQDPGVLPARFTERPLTLPRGTLHGGIGFGTTAFFGSRETTTIATMAGSVGLGIVDAFQLTITPLRLIIDPDQDAFDPFLGFFGSFVSTRTFQMGASARMSLPIVDDGAGFVGQLALDFLVRGRVFRFRGQLSSTFFLPEDGGEGSSSDIITAGALTTAFGFQAGQIFAVDIELTHILTDGEPDSYRLSPELDFIFTIPRGPQRSPLMDIQLAFFIPGLIGAGRSDTVDVRALSVTLDAVFYADLY